MTNLVARFFGELYVRTVSKGSLRMKKVSYRSKY